MQINGTTIIGDTAKTYSGMRVLNLNTMSKMAIENALKHYQKNKSKQ